MLPSEKAREGVEPASEELTGEEKGKGFRSGLNPC